VISAKAALSQDGAIPFAFVANDIEGRFLAEHVESRSLVREENGVCVRNRIADNGNDWHDRSDDDRRA
jgi:hypothetical protein